MAPASSRGQSLSPTARTCLTVSLHLGSSLLFLFAFAPAALWLAFMAFAVRACNVLGYWPSYGRPDPKNLPDSVLSMEWVDTSLALSFLALAAFLGLLGLRRFVPKHWWLLAASCVWLLAWGTSFALFRADPWGVVAWVFD